MQNYYEFLGIPNFSDIDIIRTAYRNLSKQYHPDNLVNATEEQKMYGITAGIDNVANETEGQT